MAARTIDTWMKFFRDAGINNSTAAALYASTFAENEIEENMVGDLTRDILREIGITVMGHVLAILKHAKVVHSRAENEKIVAKTSHPRISEPSPATPSTTSLPKRSTPASRIIEHYVRSSPQDIDSPEVTFLQSWPSPSAAPAAPPSPPSRPRVTDRLGALRNLVAPPGAANATSRINVERHSGATGRPAATAAALKVTDRLGIKKRPRQEGGVATATNAAGKRQRISLLSPKLVEELPVKRIRRVLPEQEGTYKITMPTGSTPLTKKLLARQGGKILASGRPKTVFDRLGADGSVSSTTDVDLVTATKAGGSVFSRLGASASSAAAAVAADQPVEYAGVLKSALFTRTFTVDTPTVKKTKTAGILANPTNAKQPSAKSRLGLTALKPGSPGTITKRKKVVLVKRSGEREIVYRDVVVAAPDAGVSTCNTLDPESRSRFRSDNIVAGRSIVQQQQQAEQEWDY